MTQEKKGNNLGIIASCFAFFIGIHIAIASMYPNPRYDVILVIHAFLISTLILGQFALKKVKKVDESRVGMAFLAITMSKMFLSFCLVFILFKTMGLPKWDMVINFFAPFFAYLIVEVMIALKQLR